MARTQTPKGATARLVPLDQLAPFPGNPRRGDVGAIADSLDALDQYRPIVVNAGGDKTHMTVLAGNHTLQGARELGWSRIRVWFVDVDDATAKRINVADNRTAELGGWEKPALATILQEIQAEAPEPADGEEPVDALAGTGFKSSDVDRLVAALAPKEAPSEFPVADPDAIETEFQCPSCGYEWSGAAKLKIAGEA